MTEQEIFDKTYEEIKDLMDIDIAATKIHWLMSIKKYAKDEARKQTSTGNPYCNVPGCHRNYHHEHYYTVIKDIDDKCKELDDFLNNQNCLLYRLSRHVKHNHIYRICNKCSTRIDYNDAYCPCCGKRQ